jgi:hypothetical protein
MPPPPAPGNVMVGPSSPEMMPPPFKLPKGPPDAGGAGLQAPQAMDLGSRPGSHATLMDTSTMGGTSSDALGVPFGAGGGGGGLAFGGGQGGMAASPPTHGGNVFAPPSPVLAGGAGGGVSPFGGVPFGGAAPVFGVPPSAHAAGGGAQPHDPSADGQAFCRSDVLMR